MASATKPAADHRSVNYNESPSLVFLVSMHDENSQSRWWPVDPATGLPIAARTVGDPTNEVYIGDDVLDSAGAVVTQIESTFGGSRLFSDEEIRKLILAGEAPASVRPYAEASSGKRKESLLIIPIFSGDPFSFSGKGRDRASSDPFSFFQPLAAFFFRAWQPAFKSTADHAIIYCMATNFKDQLRRQIQFILNSSDMFDRGYEDEAIRIATSIRVLLHDTANSTSLLTHLSSNWINLLSSAARFAREVLSDEPDIYDSITKLRNGKIGPKLGDGIPGNYAFVPADQWWTGVVYVRQPFKIQRKHIVLAAANKDGGAHVDVSLTPEYEAVMKLWVGKSDGKPDIPLPIHLIGIRQMAYDLLNSPNLMSLAR